MTSKIAKATRSTIPTPSRMARCSALMIGEDQRPSHSAWRGMTRSPYVATRSDVGLVPERALPAGGFEEHGTEFALAVPGGTQAKVAVRGPLLARMDDAVGLVEALAAARVDVPLRLLVVVEAGDVRGVEVDLGRAVGHPLGDRLGDARRFLDPDRGARPQALDLRRLAEDGHAVRGQREHAVDGVADPDGLVAQDGRHELEGLLQLELEVLLGERQLRGRQRGRGDGRDLVRVEQDRPVGVRADLEVSAVLALVHVRVHVADDRELDLAHGVRELRDRADADHLVDGRRERDRGPGHPGDPRTPGPTGDDHGVGGDIALVRADAADVAVDDVDARDLGPGHDRRGRRARRRARA